MRLYNSQTHKKEELQTVHEGKVRMYVCGPTVYDHIHIGNARTFFSFDIIRRYLIHKGFDVCFAQNITDVDDKIINKAQAQGTSSDDIAKRYSEAFIEQMRRFKIMDPDIRPRATQEIGPMIGMISKLIEKGHAYESEGDVYFAVRSYKDYGTISGRDLDDLMVGARIEANNQKRDPLDFALWKAVKPGEPSWKSPWGEGRPGWHTECSAMVQRYLGTPIDIHGGGSDLSFPHHENESAQACSCWEHKLANYWMHTGMLLVDGEKMSKSLGNFYTLKEVLDQYSPEALRLLMLQTHYRSSLDFSFERLKGAENSMARITSCIKNLDWKVSQLEKAQAADKPVDLNTPKDSRSKEQDKLQLIEEAKARFYAAMDDDFNTASAISEVFSLVSLANTYLDKLQAEHIEAGVAAHQYAQDTAKHITVLNAFAASIVELLEIFGIEIQREEHLNLPVQLIGVATAYRDKLASGELDEVLYQELKNQVPDEEFEAVDQAAAYVLELRRLARTQKNWALADSIRDELKEMGLMVEDTSEGARLTQVKR